MLVVEKLLGLRAVGGVYVALGERRPAAARDGRQGRGRARRAAGSTTTGSTPEEFRGEARLGARADPRDGRRDARRRALRVPGPLRLERRLLVPVDLQERAVRELTPEQRRAVERRDGSLLVRAGAGHGQDDRARRALRAGGGRRRRARWSQVLAITFTEKAAAEMRRRVRRRFLELGRREDARAAESAWVSTIHGSAARAAARARAQRRASTRSSACSTSSRRSGSRADAFDGALEEFMGGPASPTRSGSRWWPPTRPTGCATWCAPPTRTCAAAASAGRALRGDAPAAAGGRGRAARGGGARRARRARRVAAPAAATRRRRRSTCIEAAAPRSRAARPKALATRGLRRVPGGARRATGRSRCAEREHRDHALLRALLELYGDRYERLKRERSGLDFEDLELIARDLLAGTRACARPTRRASSTCWSTSSRTRTALQNELLELLARDNLFRVGDENQSIYRFRHADVGVFREHWERGRGGRAGARASRSTSAPAGRCSTRSTSPSSGPGASASSRCARRRARASREPRTSPCVELLVVDRAEGLLGRPAARGADPFGEPMPPRRRGGPPRRGCSRSGSTSSRATGPWSYGDVVMLFRATTAMGLFERALEERGIPCTWSAAAATGASSRWPTCATGSRRSPTRSTSWRSTRCSPRRSAGLSLDARGADRAARAALEAGPLVGAERGARARRRRARPSCSQLPEADRRRLAGIRRALRGGAPRSPARWRSRR